ncbi:conjugative transposon protein TraM [Elizabethkingia anophelis]|uniref:Conjugative transposon protein TraM n=1 Tax=Elizabethkingia anophelis TaxID=1117645 RepID=A0A455ZHQ3_9FLAO|nr:conjugative transposon protein TraM [Elizabethkingia anophelis]DAC76068.1 TPA_exp: conjugative transposon protein TraM [Elizabethkingia anophelis]DAC76131.1 TPA_exp: conjugative transposon protein TraM [Elizabethkingia anophelis]
MDIKKLNFKQPKYIIPLIALPFIIFFGWQSSQFMKTGKKEEKPKEELSLSLGDAQDSIMSKNDAYDSFFTKKDDRTMLDGLDKENDSLNQYSDNLGYKEKRYIDSLKAVRGEEMRRNENEMNRSYYKSQNNGSRTSADDRDYQRSVDLIRTLNGGGSSTSNNRDYEKPATPSQYGNSRKEDTDDPVKTLRKQMLMMDSLEKARNPEYQSKLAAEERLKKNKEKLDAFLNSTLTVSKSGVNSSFNSVFKEKENNFVKAVLDESINGYLGSRIRFRLLEDIYVGKHKVSKGALIYGQISGFTFQRVNLNVVSILNNGEILPINLSVYDTDGIQGMYVPQSEFREMMRQMGTNSVQGTQMDMSSQNFFTSIASSLFRSASQSISNLIRKNKAKLKYNSYIYLINDKELKKNENTY